MEIFLDPRNLLPNTALWGGSASPDLAASKIPDPITPRNIEVTSAVTDPHRTIDAPATSPRSRSTRDETMTDNTRLLLFTLQTPHHGGSQDGFVAGLETYLQGLALCS